MLTAARGNVSESHSGGIRFKSQSKPGYVDKALGKFLRSSRKYPEEQT
jgi:hypothetical protein